jgi:ubiquinone/menaquinone biosynthesis C-methylase UbiE
MDKSVLFDKLPWIDPISKKKMIPIITARNPSGVPLSGALRIEGSDTGYPIVDSVVRLLPSLALQYKDWLMPLGLTPPETNLSSQDLESVSSFGFQWNLVLDMRTEKDLNWRVASRYEVSPDLFQNKIILDAGAGAGDQSWYMLKNGANVVSVDLSSAINVVASKLRMNPNWVGIQSDIMNLPFSSEFFDLVYCEGVIQHTADSRETVKELTRMMKEDGVMLTTHYQRSKRLVGKIREQWTSILRSVFAKLGPWKGLLVAGNFAAIAHIPILGKIFVKSGTAIRYDLMPDFKTTWINTYDNFGPHSYQRYISEEEFISYFTSLDGIEVEWNRGTTLRARKRKIAKVANY